MKIVIDIPKEFEEHFNEDRFSDSLARILEDITSPNPVVMSGLYECETLEMFEKAFQESKPLIQCKDCEHFTDEYLWSRCALLGMPTHLADYCSRGERREDNE